MALIVQKQGGASMGSPERIHNVATVWRGLRVRQRRERWDGLMRMNWLTGGSASPQKTSVRVMVSP